MITLCWALGKVVYITYLGGASFKPRRGSYCHYLHFTDEKVAA